MLSRSAAGDVGIFLGGIALKLLAEIDDPRALRALDRAGLQTVAHELRAYLIEVGAAVGGHFAGSLGAVELTVALHATFDTPDDRIVWDVGHQTYGHKVLTGRRDELPRIKQARGPAGFLRRVERPHDVFGAGHAGTSVSAALGIAEAARRSGSARRAVAVIGDGAATTGMSFEALNHAGQLRNGLRIVFNDNGMSIAPNVGGLNRSGDIAGYVRALGIAYAGPIDGHDLDALLDALASLRDATGPALLHVKTRKGYAYEKVPDQDQFMSRERTMEFFRRVLSRPNAKRWQFNQSPLFIEFLAGAQDYDCIPWSMPAYSVFGWQKPCYLLQDGYADSYEGCSRRRAGPTTARRAATRAARDCMVHCGYEAAAVDDALSSPRGLLRMIRAMITGPRVPKPTSTPEESLAAEAPTAVTSTTPGRGWSAEASEKSLRIAFAYRGDATLTLDDGVEIVGYVMDADANAVRLLENGKPQSIQIPAKRIARVTLRGRDTAAAQRAEAAPWHTTRRTRLQPERSAASSIPWSRPTLSTNSSMNW